MLKMPTKRGEGDDDNDDDGADDDTMMMSVYKITLQTSARDRSR